MKTTQGRTLDEILSVRETTREYSKTLRSAMRQSGVPYRCAACNLGPVWNRRELTLHVDHVDGNPLDCRLPNLRFLCPNCHSQTETFGNSGKAAPIVGGMLLPRDVDAIRERYGPYIPHKRGRVSVATLARDFGVSMNTVYRVLKGQTFKGQPLPAVAAELGGPPSD